MNDTKQVIFKLDNEEYSIDIMNVSAIEKCVNLARVPNASRYIQGIINLRGDVIPVYSLRIKFGLSEKAIDDNTKLIITKSNGILIAYQVDSVVEIIEMDGNIISEAPAIVKSKDTAYIDRVANINGRMIILLDLKGMLTDEEKENVEKIVKEQ